MCVCDSCLPLLLTVLWPQPCPMIHAMPHGMYVDWPSASALPALYACRQPQQPALAAWRCPASCGWRVSSCCCSG